MDSDTVNIRNIDSLEITEDILESGIEDTAEEMDLSKIAETPKRCLNCGTEINDRFCPHCGQSAATPSKLKMKNFGKSVVMSFGRLTPGFFHTAKLLMFKPWVVIRDHLHGRCMPYSPPITMLIQIFLYATIMFAFMNALFGTELNSEASIFNYRGESAILKMIDHSVVLMTLFAGIPVCFGVYLAYYRHGARKYNFAEYLAAFVYLFGAISLWDIIFSVFNLIPGINFDFTGLTLIVIIGFSVAIVQKAFPQKSKWKSAALFLWCLFVLMAVLTTMGILIYHIV